MNRQLFAAVASAVRAWAWLYTLPLDPVERDGRRHEIASDLWESEADSGATFSAATHVLVRALLGVPDDLLWTGERVSAGDHVLRPPAIVRVAIGVIGLATVAVSASGPTLDPAQALKVNVASAGWVDHGTNGKHPGSGLAPAIAFTLTNVGDLGTSALEVNAVFHRADEAGGALGLGTAFAPVVGWRGLKARTTSARVLLHGQPRYVIDAVTARAVAVPLDHLDELHVRLFVHHKGRWTLLGDFRVPAQRMPR